MVSRTEVYSIRQNHEWLMRDDITIRGRTMIFYYIDFMLRERRETEMKECERIRLLNPANTHRYVLLSKLRKYLRSELLWQKKIFEI